MYETGLLSMETTGKFLSIVRMDLRDSVVSNPRLIGYGRNTM
jgi:hypothetical protein